MKKNLPYRAGPVFLISLFLTTNMTTAKPEPKSCLFGGSDDCEYCKEPCPNTYCSHSGERCDICRSRCSISGIPPD